MVTSRLIGRVGMLVAVSLTSAALAACGDDDDSGSDSSTVEISADCEVEVSTDTGSIPEVSLPDCDPPADLFGADVVEGSGAEAAAGDTVSVQYAGFNWSNGEKFDASWDRGEVPFEVTPLGSAPVIQGWNDGLLGAREGDRVVLVIPPHLGYGEAGAGDAIGPNETLVFVVDVVAISS